MADLRHLISDLVDALSAATPTELPGVVDATLASVEGVDSATVWLADMGYTRLLALGSRASAEVTGTVVGRCLLDKNTATSESRLFAPSRLVG